MRATFTNWPFEGPRTAYENRKWRGIRPHCGEKIDGFCLLNKLERNPQTERHQCNVAPCGARSRRFMCTGRNTQTRQRLLSSGGNQSESHCFFFFFPIQVNWYILMQKERNRNEGLCFLEGQDCVVLGSIKFGEKMMVGYR